MEREEREWEKEKDCLEDKEAGVDHSFVLKEQRHGSHREECHAVQEEGDLVEVFLLRGEHFEHGGAHHHADHEHREDQTQVLRGGHLQLLAPVSLRIVQRS